MNISLMRSQLNGFRKWSDDHPAPSNDDDNPGGASPIALVAASVRRALPVDFPHHPWAIPGVDGAF